MSHFADYPDCMCRACHLTRIGRIAELEAENARLKAVAPMDIHEALARTERERDEARAACAAKDAALKVVRSWVDNEDMKHSNGMPLTVDIDYALSSTAGADLLAELKTLREDWHRKCDALCSLEARLELAEKSNDNRGRMLDVLEERLEKAEDLNEDHRILCEEWAAEKTELQARAEKAEADVKAFRSVNHDLAARLEAMRAASASQDEALEWVSKATDRMGYTQVARECFEKVKDALSSTAGAELLAEYENKFQYLKTTADETWTKLQRSEVESRDLTARLEKAEAELAAYPRPDVAYARGFAAGRKTDPDLEFNVMVDKRVQEKQSQLEAMTKRAEKAESGLCCENPTCKHPRIQADDPCPTCASCVTEIEAQLEAMRAALGDVLGAQHVLKSAFGMLERWSQDPVFESVEQRTSHLARVRLAIETWHKRLVLVCEPSAPRLYRNQVLEEAANRAEQCQTTATAYAIRALKDKESGT